MRWYFYCLISIFVAVQLFSLKSAQLFITKTETRIDVPVKLKNENNSTMNNTPSPLLKQEDAVKQVIKNEVKKIEPEVIVDNLPSGFIKRLKFVYQPFVIPPPINEPSFFINLPFIQTNIRNKNECKEEEICKNIKDYMFQYDDKKNKLFTSINFNNFGVEINSQTLLGYVDIVKQGSIERNYDCGFKTDNLKQIRVGDRKPLHISGKVVYLIVPEGYAFQHFLDGVLPKIVQAEDFINDPEVKFFVSLSSKWPIVGELYKRLGIDTNRMIISNRNDISADELIVPCVCPPMHPYLWKRAQYLFKLPHLTSSSSSSKNENDEFFYILYLSRNKGTYNGGRRVINEKEFIDTTNDILRNTKYRFEVFDSKKYRNLDELFGFLSKVKVLMGPHGGAFYNMFFMRSGSTILEFLPKSSSFFANMVRYITYRNSVMLGHYYYALGCDTSGSSDVKINIGEFRDLLKSIIDNL